MAVIRDCEFCGTRGCAMCEPTVSELLQMRHDALQDLGEDAPGVLDLVAKQAARAGIYATDDPRNFQGSGIRTVVLPCAFCKEHAVIEIKGCGHFCTKCQEKQPTEITTCVFCGLNSAYKTIENHRCILCDREQPKESSVVPFKR